MASKILSGYQTMAFWFASVVALLLIIVVDIVDWSDPCLIIYGVDTLIAFICASMFSDWWRVKGSATSIFKWLTILLFALTFNDGIQFYARWLYEYHNPQYKDFLDTWFWNYRSVPKMVALIYLLSFAIWQRFGSQSTYHNGIRKDMANGFDKLNTLIEAGEIRVDTLEARIVDGELRFESHTHDKGMVVAAKFVLKPEVKK
jgi:hypothetical protein